MHKIKFQGKFFKSLNFRIMLFLLLMGTVPALIIGGVFLMSYERQAMAQLSNDVKNQCQILSTQLRDGENLLKTEDEMLQGELTQLASLYEEGSLLLTRIFRSSRIRRSWKKAGSWWQKKWCAALRGRIPATM